MWGHRFASLLGLKGEELGNRDELVALDELLYQGYKFVTVSQLLSLQAEHARKPVAPVEPVVPAAPTSNPLVPSAPNT